MTILTCRKINFLIISVDKLLLFNSNFPPKFRTDKYFTQEKFKTFYKKINKN